jgi:hypothetical protein
MTSKFLNYSVSRSTTSKDTYVVTAEYMDGK